MFCIFHCSCQLVLFWCSRFTKDGVLIETLFWNDVDKLIDDYGNESRKAK